MDHFQKYIEQHKVAKTFITDWHKSVSTVVVIPCYNEPEVHKTIESLLNCEPVETNVEVIILINSGEKSPDEIVLQNRDSYNEISGKYPFNKSAAVNIRPVIIEGIRKKHQGAGYARKLGMDLAVSLFAGIDNKNGLIVSLDADTIVAPNYLYELFSVYKQYKIGGGTISFEHRLEGLSKDHFKAICLYELHLRYFHLMLKDAGFPYWFFTIGSAFFVRANHYVSHGGMNRKQGGEDFYFLHKVFPDIEYVHLNSTTVYPSSRVSLRVPFGTGPKIKQILKRGDMLTYHPEAFSELKSLFDIIPALYESADSLHYLLNTLPECIREFLIAFDIENKLKVLHNNTGDQSTFTKRFFKTFDGFFVVKFLNYAHSEYYNMMPVEEALRCYCTAGKLKYIENIEVMLRSLRQLDSIRA